MGGDPAPAEGEIKEDEKKVTAEKKVRMPFGKGLTAPTQSSAWNAALFFPYLLGFYERGRSGSPCCVIE